jgi:hypothetical protein
MICPACGSTDIRVSKHPHWDDFLQRARGREAFRCRKCRLRFFASPGSEADPVPVHQSTHTHRPKRLISSRTKNRLVKRVVVISIFAVAFILFWFFLRYLTTEHMLAPESRFVSSSPFYMTA